MENIVINKELEELLPPLAEDEFKQLEENILKNGIQDPILLWNDTIIDGHNRYKIAEKNGLSFDVKRIELRDLNDAKLFILRNQIGRRNLTPYQKVEYAKEIVELLNFVPNEGRRPLAEGEEYFSERKKLSEISGVSEGNVGRVEYLEKNAPKEIMDALRNDDISINAAYQFMKKDPGEWVDRIESGEMSPKEAIDGRKKELEEEESEWEKNKIIIPKIPSAPKRPAGGLSAADLFGEDEFSTEGNFDDLADPFEIPTEDSSDEEDDIPSFGESSDVLDGDLPSFLANEFSSTASILEKTKLLKPLMEVDLIKLKDADETYIKDYLHYYGEGLTYEEMLEHFECLLEELESLIELLQKIIDKDKE